MNNDEMYNLVRPKRRSKLRIAVGKLVYKSLRYLQWIRNRKIYSLSNRSLDNLADKSIQGEINNNSLKLIKAELVKPLSFTVIKHKSLLYKELRNVDMWMQENKVENLKIAIQALNGLIVEPGKVFSYWRCIGKPSKRKGYKEGMQLSHGKFASAVGGGLCQLSNLIYWMMLHTPLDVTERHRHSYDVFPDTKRTVPFGSGATCVYNYFDLQIKNNTTQSFQLLFSLDEKYLRGEIRSEFELEYHYQVYEKSHQFIGTPWGQYIRQNKIYRDKLDESSRIIESDFITQNHALTMYNPMLGSGKSENRKMKK